MKRQEGSTPILVLVGLAMFAIGIICLLVWGVNMTSNGAWFFPGLLLGGAGAFLMVLGIRSGG